MTSPPRRRHRRRRLVAEVIQSSAMDCGPATLKCLLESHGLSVSYGRLREACQTDVDGTSIDTIEDVAVQLGLEAEQVMVPPDHILTAEAAALPAIAVVLSPGGLTHFVVVWSCVAGLVQIMDPAVGRRFVPREQLQRELFVHRMPVPAEDLREWLGGDEFTGPLRVRARALKLARARVDAWLAAGLADPGILGLARVDAAVRLAESLARAGALARGGEAERFVAGLLAASEGLGGDALFAVLPEQFFTAAPGPDDDTALLRGAVLVRVAGVRPDAPALHLADLSQSTLSPDLVAALTEPQISPLRQLFALVRADGLALPAVLGLGLVAAAAVVVAEALVLRALLDVGERIGVGEQRLGAAAAILAFFVAVLALELPLAAGVRRVGRRLSARLRVAFLTQIPRLGDRYLASRPISDMAERCHRGHVLRHLPDVAARLVRGGFELLFTALALIWLDPGGAPWIVLTAVLVLALPLALQPVMTERDLKARSHGGALGRFYLDALLGLTAIRTHAAERSLLREHEALLVEWSRAQRSLFRVQVVAVGLSAALGMILAAVLWNTYVTRHPEPAGALLLLYWALSLPAIGDHVAAAAFEIPALRAAALRLLEPLHTTADAPEPVVHAEPWPGSGGVALSFAQVSAVAGGHPILQELDLQIAPGEHVAVVGASGAGKSSLLGLLLGWHRPAGGRLEVDGKRLDEPALAALRRVTAWVDPAVQLWNQSLLRNLRYGSDAEHHRLPQALELADLGPVLERLPDGLQSILGEGGGLVSGGEGQRVRLGRALLREEPRLVLLDEPFRGLDRHARAALLTRAREHWRTSTLLCVTHDIDAALGFDRVLVIDGGRLVEDGAPKDLSEQPDSRFAALLRAETELRAEGWSDPRWRRLRMDGGHLRAEEAAT
ncbi:cysteine peptidase family C39 domain-containing protein [Nannocystis punicea]|uniref:Cysteine peptidase family C39 domain-containing protein n=1 Tax=Nannocystis punicea TaxID=2995304 RepID=A0ABY7H4H0_9BACT|nr:cysteine peptidase family C39 domain-containing protein [Nannocystis poenicansa]WAS94166.1 cysteine peptidase family C39 domain-containing protein [Nannocystis poenicansa]